MHSLAALRGSRRTVHWAVAALLAVAFASAARSSDAAIFTVNSTDDGTDGSCGAVVGGCTLHEAIEAAVAIAGRDTIAFDPAVFPPGAPGVISLFEITPVIRDPAGTVLDGAGAGVVIQAGNLAGPSENPLVFESGPGTPLQSVTVANVTVLDFAGSGIVICGGVFPDCDEDLSGVLVQHVVATGHGADGISIDGRVVTKVRITESALSGNGGSGIHCNAAQSLLGTRIEGSVARNNSGGGADLIAVSDMVGTLVTDFVAVHNGGSGIQINGAQRTMKTKLMNVTVTENASSGITVRAGSEVSATTISSAVASFNDNDGVEFGSGNLITASTLKGVVANTNLGAGIRINAGGKVVGARITDAKAVGNAGEGIHFGSGDGVTRVNVSRTIVAGNAGIGLRLQGTLNVVKEVRANGNGAGIQLDAPGGGNVIEKCTAHANNGAPGGAGIAVADGNTANVIQKNVSLGNDGPDLTDGNTNCDANSWTKNVFFSRSDPCID